MMIKRSGVCLSDEMVFLQLQEVVMWGQGEHLPLRALPTSSLLCLNGCLCCIILLNVFLLVELPMVWRVRYDWRP